MTKKLTVTVGIPAYNEEQNIARLLKALLRQKQTNFTLKEIIVVSDGSDDSTVDIVKQFDDQRVCAIAGRKRLGQQVRQNQLLRSYRGDVLVLVEADTLPANDNTLAELVAPFTDKRSQNLGLAVSDRQAVAPARFFERLLWHGGELKDRVFQNWQRGANFYTSNGHAFRAIPRRVTEVLLWPNHVPEDTYLYLFVRQLRLRVVRRSKSKVYMKHVTSVADRLRQCAKYNSGKRELALHFPAEFLRAEYTLPLALVSAHIWRALLAQPFWTTLALFEMVVNRFLALLQRRSFTAFYVPYRTSKDFGQLDLSSYAS